MSKPLRRIPSSALVLTSVSLLASARAESPHVALISPPVGASVEQLLVHIDGLSRPFANPQTFTEANEIRRSIALAVVSASDAALGQRPTSDQSHRAVAAKADALRVLEGLGELGELPGADEWLERTIGDPRPAVAMAALRSHVAERVRHWRALSADERDRLLCGATACLHATPPTAEHAKILSMLADALAGTKDEATVLELIEGLRPSLDQHSLDEHNSDELVAELSLLDGVVRKLNLPGNPLAVEGALLTGERIDWDAYRGKVVLIDYWATWCGLCHSEMARLRGLHSTYADRGFEVIGVSLDTDQTKAAAFVARHSIHWPVLFGHSEATRGWNHPMAARYGVRELPQAILVDRDGRVVSVDARGDKLASEVRRLLDAEPRAGVSGEGLVAESSVGSED